jgi:hypothetical protein
VIPDAIPAAILVEFEFLSEFHRNGNHNLAGTTAKIPFPRNSRNLPDSARFQQEYMGDCKELHAEVHPTRTCSMILASLKPEGQPFVWRFLGN